MATGQTVLDLMQVLNRELRIGPGEADVTRALRAANAALDLFETAVALERNALVGSAIATVSTTAQQETTPWPTGFLRIDAVQRLDPVTALPVEDLLPIADTGGHVAGGWWAWIGGGAPSVGRPRAYWTNGAAFFWAPIPDGTYTLRVYGFQSAADLTTAEPYPYPDVTILPVATVAVRLLLVGVGDSVEDISAMAADVFAPVVRMLARFRRDQVPSLRYRDIPET